MTVTKCISFAISYHGEYEKSFLMTVINSIGIEILQYGILSPSVYNEKNLVKESHEH